MWGLNELFIGLYEPNPVYFFRKQPNKPASLKVRTQFDLELERKKNKQTTVGRLRRRDHQSPSPKFSRSFPNTPHLPCVLARANQKNRLANVQRRYRKKTKQSLVVIYENVCGATKSLSMSMFIGTSDLSIIKCAVSLRRSRDLYIDHDPFCDESKCLICIGTIDEYPGWDWIIWRIFETEEMM